MNDSPEAALARVRREDEGDTGAWDRLLALAQDMERNGRHREDPMREVLVLLGDRWTPLILLTLGAGSWRHATLRRIIGALSIEGAISQRVLTLKLRALERDGFVLRSVSADVPPQVSYRLSETGRSLRAEAERLLGWVRDRQDVIMAARRAFDGREQT